MARIDKTLVRGVVKKNGHGGFRKGAGRKPKSEVNKTLDLFKRIVTEADQVAIIEVAIEQAKAGDRHARQFLADRLYGKPKETIDLNMDKPLLVIDE